MTGRMLATKLIRPLAGNLTTDCREIRRAERRIAIWIPRLSHLLRSPKFPRPPMIEINPRKRLANPVPF
jgi:hypothetical protein